MEEKETLCAIPRNLNKSDIIIHYPIKLKWKQIAYIGASIGGAYLVFQTGIPHLYKVALMSGSVIAGTFLSFVKYEDSDLDELAVDSLHYFQKQNVCKQLLKRGELVVNINTKKEGTGEKVIGSSFTLPTTEVL